MAPWLSKYEAFLRLNQVTNSADLLRARGIYIFGWTFILTQFVNQGLMYKSYGEWSFDHWLSMLSVITIVIAIHLVRYFKRFGYFALFFSAMIFSAVWASAVIDGRTGINSALLPLIISGSIICGFIADWRAVLIYTFFAMIVLSGLYYVSVSAAPLIYLDPALDATRNFQRMAQAMLGLVLVASIVGMSSYHMNALFDGLEDAVREARKADLAKSQFLANMSHELRTPLNGVIGMSELLVKTDLNETQHTYAQIVANSSRSLVSIINDVLDISKIDAGKINLEVRSLNLSAMISALVALHKPAAVKKGIDLSLNYAAHLPQYILGDEGRLRQVVNNLIGNAMKFTTHGHVKIWVDGRSVSDDQFEIFICVQDTGIGIAPHNTDKIFERFEQIDTELSRGTEGTGLGLTICKEFVQAMGGTIKVQSTPHLGSMFSFNLTVQVPGAQQVRQAPTQSLRAAS